MAYLVVLNGRERGRVVPLDAPILLAGQRKDAGLSLDNPWVSWEHARFVREGGAGAGAAGSHALEDLGSTNGTYVNCARVERARLAPDDVVFLGPIHVLYCEGDAPAQPARAPAAGGAAAGPGPSMTASGARRAAMGLSTDPDREALPADAERTMRISVGKADQTLRMPPEPDPWAELAGFDDEIDRDLLEALEIVDPMAGAGAALGGGGSVAGLGTSARISTATGSMAGGSPAAGTMAAPGTGAAAGPDVAALLAARDAEIARLRAVVAAKESEVRGLVDELHLLKERYLDL